MYNTARLLEAIPKHNEYDSYKKQMDADNKWEMDQDRFIE